MLKAGSYLVVLSLTLFSYFSQDAGRGPLRVESADEVAQVFRDILFAAASFELLAVNPDWPTEESLGTLHGYTVPGRTMEWFPLILIRAKPASRRSLLGSRGFAL